MVKTKQQRLEEVIPTLASQSIGSLWDGVDEGIVNQPTDAQELLEGSVPHADDMRVLVLAGALLESSCRQKVSALVSNDELRLHESIYGQLIDKMSSHIASVIRFARFHAEDGDDNITVKISSTFVHGRSTMTDANVIDLLYTDTLCEKCAFDVVKLAYETSIKIFEELGFFIQRHGIAGFVGANGAMVNEERSYRLSWFKPSIWDHRREVEYASQVDAYVSGVPLDDIFA